MARRRRLPRYKKTAIFVAGIGVAGGIAAVILWPQIKRIFQQPSVTAGKPVIRPVEDEIDYDWVDTLPYYQLLGLR